MFFFRLQWMRFYILHCARLDLYFFSSFFGSIKKKIHRLRNETDQFWINEPKENDNRQFSIEWLQYLGAAHYLSNFHIETILFAWQKPGQTDFWNHTHIQYIPTTMGKNINACTHSIEFINYYSLSHSFAGLHTSMHTHQRIMAFIKY